MCTQKQVSSGNVPIFLHNSGDSLILHIRVSPNASKSKFVGLYQNELKIAVKAPPVDGAANKELIRFLAKSLGIPKSSLTLLRGETSRSKQIAILSVHEKIVSTKLDEIGLND